LLSGSVQDLAIPLHLKDLGFYLDETSGSALHKTLLCCPLVLEPFVVMEQDQDLRLK
jgi:hypothetical protein